MYTITATEAGVACIAPYLGRISDWHKAHGVTDMGVETVTNIQNHLRKYGFRTQVMGASFRNTVQAKALTGVDLLTIGPPILELLESEKEVVKPILTVESGEYTSSYF